MNGQVEADDRVEIDWSTGHIIFEERILSNTLKFKPTIPKKAANFSLYLRMKNAILIFTFA